MGIQLNNERIVTDSKAEFLLIFEEKPNVGEGEQLFFVFLASANNFIQGK